VKIALLIHELETQGGGERQCVALARELQRAGHDVSLFTSAYDPNCYAQICSELKIRVTGRGWFPRLGKSAYLRRFLDMWQMLAAINEAHDIWNPHHWPAHWAAVWLKQKLGGRVVWMCNDVPDLKQKYESTRVDPSPVARMKAWLYRWMWKYDARQIKDVDATVVLSDWTRSELLKVYDTPVSVVRSGMDSGLRVIGDSRKIRHRFGFAPKDFVVLWFGILMPHRRLEDGIIALARLRERGIKVRLLIAGSPFAFPDYAGYLKTITGELKVQDAVAFAGPVPEAEVPDFYAASDVFLFPNEEQTWGLVVIEAMAAGKPVVVSTGSGVHEVLEDNKTALKVPPRDPDAIANKLEFLYRNPTLRGTLAESGREYSLSRFSWERYAHEMVDAFDQTNISSIRRPGNVSANATTLATAGRPGEDTR
jgi:glycosyltransferase involved in cell wall biosynthesis